MAIEIIVTTAGRAALVNAVNTGTNAVTITQLGITAAVFVPNAGQVALPGEIKRIASVAGVVVADDQIHVTASDVTTDAYAMRGFALYLNDGTLFAIYGQAGAILNKTAESMMLLAADIAFADIDAELIEFGDTNFILPPATTEILGLVELATTGEAQTGSDPARVLTPLTGKQSVLGWLLSQDGSGSGLDADLLDGQQGAYYLPAASYTAADVLAKLLGVDGAGSGVDADLLDGQQGAYYLPAGSYTAADVFAKVLGLDGSGSGLDADLLDGLHAAAFALAGHNHNIAALTGYGTMASQNANAVAITGGAISGVTLNNIGGQVGIATNAPAERVHIETGHILLPFSSANSGALLGYPSSQNFTVTGGVLPRFGLKWFVPNDATGNPEAALVGYGGIRLYTQDVLRLRIYQDGSLAPGQDGQQVFGLPTHRWHTGYFSNGILIGGNTVWHAGNDGSGSGLDADLLDGQHGSYYLPAASYTAADVLAKLLGVDGAGTGLDADLLDGQHGAYYLPAASYTAADVLTKLLGVDGSGSGLDADTVDGLNAAALVKYADFTGSNQSFGSSGYQKLPGGLIIQWGTYFIGANTSISATFPIAFPTACLFATTSGGRVDTAAQDNNPFVSGATQYAATIYASTDVSTSGGWIAIGY